MNKKMREKIAIRIKTIKDWLMLEHPDIFHEQKHLDEGTTERAYWHYGYLVALKDILNLKNTDNKELEKFFANITDIRITLWPNSWGRLQCNTETADCKMYHSWSGDARDEISVELIIEAFRLIGEQLPDEVKCIR